MEQFLFAALVTVLSCQVAVTSGNGLEARVRILEEKAFHDSMEFRKKFDGVFALLNKSFGTVPGHALSRKKQPSEDLFKELKEYIYTDINVIKVGLAAEKKFVRTNSQQLNENVKRIKREFETSINDVQSNLQMYKGMIGNYCTSPEETRQARDVIVESLNDSINRVKGHLEERRDTCSRKLEHDVDEIRQTVSVLKATMIETLGLLMTEQRLALNAFLLGVSGSSWRKFGDSYYYSSTEKLSWKDATVKCSQLLNGYLVEVNSKAENTFIKDTWKDIGNIWLGASDLDEEGVWIWQHTGSRVDSGYTDWLNGEPSNLLRREHCLHQWDAYKHKWNDAPCGSKMAFVCEVNVEEI